MPVKATAPSGDTGGSVPEEEDDDGGSAAAAVNTAIGGAIGLLALCIMGVLVTKHFYPATWEKLTKVSQDEDPDLKEQELPPSTSFKTPAFHTMKTPEGSVGSSGRQVRLDNAPPSAAAPTRGAMPSSQVPWGSAKPQQEEVFSDNGGGGPPTRSEKGRDHRTGGQMSTAVATAKQRTTLPKKVKAYICDSLVFLSSRRLPLLAHRCDSDIIHDRWSSTSDSRF